MWGEKEARTRNSVQRRTSSTHVSSDTRWPWDTNTGFCTTGTVQQVVDTDGEGRQAYMSGPRHGTVRVGKVCPKQKSIATQAPPVCEGWALPIELKCVRTGSSRKSRTHAKHPQQPQQFRQSWWEAGPGEAGRQQVKEKWREQREGKRRTETQEGSIEGGRRSKRAGRLVGRKCGGGARATCVYPPQSPQCCVGLHPMSCPTPPPGARSPLLPGCVPGPPPGHPSCTARPHAGMFCPHLCDHRIGWGGGVRTTLARAK